MGFFNKKGKEEAKSAMGKVEANASKNQLIRFLDQLINKDSVDEIIRRQMIEIKSKLEYAPPTSDRRATELDTKTRLLFEKYNGIKHMVEPNRNPTMIEQYMLESNRGMFNTCANLIREQLLERTDLMSDAGKVYTEKELAILPEYQRFAYRERESTREALAKKWNIEFVIASFAIRMQKMLCEKKCKQFLMEEIFQKGKADPANKSTYAAQYNQLADEIKRLERFENELDYEIKQNKEIQGVIDESGLKKIIATSQSAEGANIVEELKKESKIFEEISKKVQSGRDKVDGILGDVKKIVAQTAAPKRSEGEYEARMESDALRHESAKVLDPWADREAAEAEASKKKQGE
ncbi:MAG: hypothetical protein FWD49_02515 [Firmicutes bacterium]|nr:hypothetical protein [Bacillota bacterium]